MTDFRPVTDSFAVAPQIDLDDIAAAAQQGVVLVISNRPDGEDPGAPSAREFAAAAQAAGLQFLHIPVVGGPTRDQAQAMAEAVAAAAGPVLAFCRSGTRSINTWALGQALSGAPTGPLVEAGARAGYDLRPLLG